MKETSKVAQKIAQNYKAYVSDETEDTVIVEIETENIQLAQEMLAATGKRTIFKKGLRDEIDEKISRYKDETSEKEEGYIGRLYERIIKNAYRKDASDIHIEPFESQCFIRFRIDGRLIKVEKISKKECSSLVSYIKLRAGMDITERKIPRDGRMDESCEDGFIDIRVSSIPTVNGEKLVLRMLNRNSFVRNINEIGFSKEAVSMIREITSQSKGLFLVCGPTGSGKTTTVYSIIKELMDDEKNITTIENPVEYRIDGINQIQINRKKGLDFNECLKSVLRQDPDIIMVGEIRDTETAETAVRAAITGHLVISTLHTEDAVSAIIRLEDMGIKPYMISASLRGIIAQKLVRKLNNSDTENLFKNKKYRGRTAVYEIMAIDKNIKERIRLSLNREKIIKRAGNKFIGFEKTCFDAISSGTTDMEECIIAGCIKQDK